MVSKILAGVITTKTKEHIIFPRRIRGGGVGGGGYLSGHGSNWKFTSLKNDVAEFEGYRNNKKRP